MKKVLIVICVLFLVGCNNKEIKEAYQTIEKLDDNINSYSMDLRIYGVLDNKKVNEIVKVRFSNGIYEISKKINDNILNNIIDSNMYSYDSDKDLIYVINNKTHVKENDIYVVATDNIKYSNLSVYLDTLNNIKKIYTISEEKIGEHTYKKYNVTIDNNAINDIMNNAISNQAIDAKNNKADIYVDENNNLYKIVYYLGSITINASYFRINEKLNIYLPDGL